MKDEEVRRTAFTPYIPAGVDHAAQPFELLFQLPRAGTGGRYDLPLDDIPRVIDPVAAARPAFRFVIDAEPPFADGHLPETLAYSLRRGVRCVLRFRGEPSEVDLALAASHGVDEFEPCVDALDPACRRTLLRLAEGRFRVGLRFALSGANLTVLGLALDAARETGCDRFTVVFPATRAEAGLLSATDVEDAFNFLYQALCAEDLFIDTDRAPHFRRFILERLIDERRRFGRPPVKKIYLPGIRLAMQDTLPLLRAPEWLKSDPAMKTHGLSAGDGLLCVARDGRILPSEAFPLDAGNVHTNDPLEVYRESTLFRDLRSRRRVKGKCRACAYLNVCGGSRERAWHYGGDPYLEEPLCGYLYHGGLARL